ncbi:MAG: 1-acyl-sn-glycerol-3-phosphate acyltransferase [Paludibacteraceae bacterium]|nr:1-acyl-sn-glycerol-3-phosphate acyltransferase [Paludibacteraceae bacterium]
MQSIDIHSVIAAKMPGKRVPECLIRYLERITHAREINAFMEAHPDLKGLDFLRAVIYDEFQCDFEVQGLYHLPKDNKPLLFVSNHPLGGLDGMILTLLLSEQRQRNIKVIVNDLLMNLEPLEEFFVPVNKTGSQTRAEVKAQKALWASDSDILTFPAGACSRRKGLCGKIEDLEWKNTFIRRARQTGRTIVPIYFEGRNSNFFYRLSFWRRLFGLPNIEMLYLADEMYRSRGKCFDIYILPPFTVADLSSSKTDKQNAQLIKHRVYENHYPPSR